MSAVRSFTFLGHPWHVLSCEYATEAAAKQTWNALNVIDTQGRGALEIGVYRHALGFDAPAVYVSVVSHKPEGMEVAERILLQRRGRPVELGRDLEEGLIARRIRVMAAFVEQGASYGSHVIRRPPKRGGILRPDGTIAEQIGGDE